MQVRCSRDLPADVVRSNEYVVGVGLGRKLAGLRQPAEVGQVNLDHVGGLCRNRSLEFRSGSIPRGGNRRLLLQRTMDDKRCDGQRFDPL